MGKTINVVVKDKIAATVDNTVYVCGNSDFVIVFDFDEEWEEHIHKTARFIWNGMHQDVVFSGNECEVPVMSNTHNFMVGVFAGDLATTTPAYVPATKSILCGTTPPASPPPDVYAQMVALFQSGLDEGRVNANKAEEAAGKAESAQNAAETASANAATAAKEAVNEYMKDYRPESGGSVQSVNGKTGAVVLNAGDVGAVGNDQLPNVITSALQQAKESGEFDGKDAEFFVVNLVADDSNSEDIKYYTDKTSQEIFEAYRNEQSIYCAYNFGGIRGVLPPFLVADNYVLFTGIGPWGFGTTDLGVQLLGAIIEGSALTLIANQITTMDDVVQVLNQALEQAIEQGIIPNKTSDLTNDSGFIVTPTTASVGQTIVVSEVDKNGKPTKWEAMDVGAGGGENLDLFYGALIRRKANPREPLAIKTYPGGLDQPTHPKVLYFPNGWNGHKYWMAYTPYPNNNNFEENPCITYSDDGEVWSEAGIANPIIRSEHRGSFYSDPHLVYVPDTNTMELWVRWCSNGSDGMAYGWEGVYRLKSTDGVNWSEKEYLFNVVDPSWASVLSPVAIYDEGKYKIWYCYKRECLKYYESEDGTNWVHIRDISENLTPIGQYKLWHFDIIKTDKGYEFVGCYQLNGAFDRNNYIAYSWSADNEGYTPAVCILDNGASGQFDDLELYRPSLVKIGNKYRVYYGAQKNIRIWHIGLVEAPAIELLHELLRVNTTGTLPTYSGGGDTGGGEDTEATLSSISATYSGGDVTAGTPVTALSGIIVTAYYSDGTSSVVTDYTLSGEIAEGSNTVVVSYGGLTTTITVTGVAGYDEPKEIVINNLFNHSTMNQTGFYDANSGKFTEDNINQSSDFIPVEPGDNIEFKGVSAAYFDANRNFVSGIPYSSTIPKTATVPDGVAYISFAFDKRSTQGLYLLVLPVKEADIAIGEDVATSANIDRTGYYDDGTFKTDSTYGTLKMTNVSPGMVFTGTNVSTASFYDIDKNWFSGMNTWIWPITIPKNAVYMAVSFNKSQTPSVVRKE